MTDTNSNSQPADQSHSVSNMLSEFIGVVAHNIHTPVGAIKWAAETLIKGDLGALTSDQKEAVQDIYDAADRLNDLSRTILYVYELEKDLPLIKTRDISLDEILVRVQRSLSSVLEKYDAKIVAGKEERARHVFADPDIAFMIMRTLVENAICYAPQYSEIHILAMQNEHGTTFSVQDNGCGIPSDERPFIFRKFYRTDSAKKIWTDGVGLNLYIAYNLATRTGGDLTFKSMEEKGSTFMWFVPVHKIRKEPWER